MQSRISVGRIIAGWFVSVVVVLIAGLSLPVFPALFNIVISSSWIRPCQHLYIDLYGFYVTESPARSRDIWGGSIAMRYRQLAATTPADRRPGPWDRRRWVDQFRRTQSSAWRAACPGGGRRGVGWTARCRSADAADRGSRATQPDEPDEQHEQRRKHGSAQVHQVVTGLGGTGLGAGRRSSMGPARIEAGPAAIAGPIPSWASEPRRLDRRLNLLVIGLFVSVVAVALVPTSAAPMSPAAPPQS
jgi:hypothetical protein